MRRYSTQLPRDPHYRLKATLATGYVVSALALPFVPPLLETRRAKADGSYLTRWVCSLYRVRGYGMIRVTRLGHEDEC
jgi:hypothetical protein